MRVVQLQRHPRGYRLYVVDQRVHHGAYGVVLGLAALAARKRRLAAVLFFIAADDWRDWKVWFKREAFAIASELSMCDTGEYAAAEGTSSWSQISRRASHVYRSGLARLGSRRGSRP